MAAIPQTVNGISATRIRLVIPYRGVWLAECELVYPDAKLAVLTGPAVVVVGGMTLLGTIDPSASSSFLDRVTVRVVGGANGWSKTVSAQHFAGVVLSSLVTLQTGAQVGERCVDPLPIAYGQNYIRMAGAASSVLEGRQWFVELTTGTTIVADWPPRPMSPDVQVLDWDNTQLRANLASDSLVTPGTILLDTRFNGKTYTVRDVEAVFSAEGSTITAWCGSEDKTRLASTLRGMVQAFAQTDALKFYVYRFVADTAGGLALQGITPKAPDLNPIEQWGGMQGVVAKLTPGTQVVIGFAGGDLSQPFIAAYSLLTPPLELDLAGGAAFLVPAPWAAALQVALVAFATGLNITTLSGQAATLVTALGLLPPGSTILTKAT
jgi:hypothetical protein